MSQSLPESIAPPTGQQHAGGRGGFYLCLLIVIATGARLAWLAALPSQAISIDLSDWHRVAEGLQLGMNPYARSHFLNWPPFWMEVIGLCQGISARLGWGVILCIRCVLIVADLAVLVATFFLLRKLNMGGRYFLLLLVGFCLNPLLVLLTVQHGNFDAFAELWIILMLLCLIRFRRGGDEIDYLLAAMCLGMGGFTKTFPLMLWPLMVPGAKRVRPRARWLAAALIVGPALLSLAPLYVLNPSRIFSAVIQYRSAGANFGLLGLATIIAIKVNYAGYASVFTYVFLAGLAVLALYLWRRDLRRDADLVLLATVILLTSFVLGPGYASQYWFWVVPLMLVIYHQYRSLRIIVFLALVVIVGTNIFEYAINPSLGRFWICWHPRSALARYGEQIVFSDPKLAMLRLAMTVASIALLAALGIKLIGNQIIARSAQSTAA